MFLTNVKKESFFFYDSKNNTVVSFRIKHINDYDNYGIRIVGESNNPSKNFISFWKVIICTQIFISM
jgi:hypothetical protein